MMPNRNRPNFEAAFNILEDIYNNPSLNIHYPEFNSYSIFNWNDHAKLPVQTTKYMDGVYSLRDYMDSNKATRMITISKPGCFSNQIHEDMDEHIHILRGSITESITGKTLYKGDQYIIPAGTKHGFYWDKPGVLIDLTYIKK
jgi:mannose-6-phosphate isomerase-like protein (cupin superfamily)